MVILITALRYIVDMAAEVSILRLQLYCSSCYSYSVAGGTTPTAARKAEGLCQRRVA
jgi:hypothetical protein